MFFKVCFILVPFISFSYYIYEYVCIKKNQNPDSTFDGPTSYPVTIPNQCWIRFLEHCFQTNPN